MNARLSTEAEEADLIVFPDSFYFVEGEDEDDVCWRRLSAAEGYTVLGMYAEAHRELDIVEKETGFDSEADLRRLDVYFAEERWDQVTIYGEIVTKFCPDLETPFLKYAAGLHAQGRTALAIEKMWLAPGKLERDPDYHFQLAGYEMVCGNRQASIAHLRNAIVLKPELVAAAAIDERLAPLLEELPASMEFAPVRPIFLLDLDDDSSGSVEFNCPF